MSIDFSKLRDELEEEKTGNANLWSVRNPRLRGLVIASINRGVWARDPAKKVVKDRCRVDVVVGEYKNGRPKVKRMYRCPQCEGNFDNLDVDHIVPRIDEVRGWEGFETWLERTFCGEEGLQALCRGCHTEKTVAENAGRRENRRRRKNASSSD
jgi:5-methylcytosine-specific restriction endonuclease McrA